MLQIPWWVAVLSIYLAWNCGFLGAAVYHKLGDPSWPKRWRATWWELALAGLFMLIAPVGAYLLLPRIGRRAVVEFRMRKAAWARRRAVRHA